jgi:hypothetical protein
MKENISLMILKKRREIGAVLFIICFAFIFYALFLLMKWTNGDPRSITFAIGYCAIGLLAILLMLIVKKLSDSKYDVFEQSFEAAGRQLILQAFGRNVYQKLQSEDANFIPLHGIEVCRQLLQSQETGANMNLRFYVLIKLARYYARDGQPLKAVETLQAALEIKPNNAVANSRLAERFEMKGKGKEAIVHYELAQKDDSIPSGLKDYFAAQIMRVKTEGPCESGPFDGSGVWWMWGA